MIQYWNNIHFVQPQWFWLFIVLPLLWILYYFLKPKRYPTITVSTIQGLKNSKSLLAQFRFILPLLRSMAIVGLILAMARPKKISSNEKINKEVVDIVLCIDISTSMLARDFKPDRLEAVKKVAKEFIAKRDGDRVGLVVFSGESFTQCPITIDHSILYNLIDNTKLGVLEDGTAIGMGLATSVNRLKESNAKSKVVILLTDGVNNSGIIDPLTAANLASTMNVKVYTIGAGTNGQAYSPIGIKPDGSYVFGMAEVKIDEPLLKTISNSTNGKYFRATNTSQLRAIYNEIDKLEKTKIEVFSTQKQEEAFFPFIVFSLICMIVHFILRTFVFNSIP
jgi:Ca-activated chloride channel family protein